MNKNKNKNGLPKIKARSYLELAKIYLRIGLHNKTAKEFYRGAVDTGYNAAELSIKGLLSLKTATLPSTHGGIVQLFGKEFVLTGSLDKETGRNLSRALRTRNLARYESKITITSIQVKEVISLAKTLIRQLEKRIE